MVVEDRPLPARSSFETSILRINASGENLPKPDTGLTN
jgi:hypothetical protein